MASETATADISCPSINSLRNAGAAFEIGASGPCDTLLPDRIDSTRTSSTVSSGPGLDLGAAGLREVVGPGRGGESFSVGHERAWAPFDRTRQS